MGGPVASDKQETKKHKK